MVPALTAAQKTALKNDIAANTNVITVTYDTGAQVTDQIKNLPNDGTTANAIAAWYNLFPGTNFFAYYATVPIAAVRGAIQWKKLTPADAVPTTPALTVQVWQARNEACRVLQNNLAMLLSPMGSGGVIDATPNRIVQGFNDALSAVPSNTGGVAQDAGWNIPNGVQSVLCRKVTNAEKLLADVTNGSGANQTGTTTGPAACTAEGDLTGPEVFVARSS